MVRNVKLGQKRRGGELLNADSGKLAKTRNDPVKHAADQSRLQQAAASHLRHALLEDSASDLRKAIQKALSYKCFSEQGQTIRDARAILAELVLSSGTVSEDDEEVKPKSTTLKIRQVSCIELLQSKAVVPSCLALTPFGLSCANVADRASSANCSFDQCVETPASSASVCNAGSAFTQMLLGKRLLPKVKALAAFNGEHPVGSLGSTAENWPRDLQCGKDLWKCVEETGSHHWWLMLLFVKMPPCSTFLFDELKDVVVDDFEGVRACLFSMLEYWKNFDASETRKLNADLHVCGGHGPVAFCTWMGVSAVGDNGQYDATVFIARCKLLMHVRMVTLVRELHGAVDWTFAEAKNWCHRLRLTVVELKPPLLSGGAYNLAWCERALLVAAGFVACQWLDVPDWTATIGPLMCDDVCVLYKRPAGLAAAVNFVGLPLLLECNICQASKAVEIIREVVGNYAAVVDWLARNGGELHRFAEENLGRSPSAIVQMVLRR